eukprot:TRINITY_DN10772_c0_g1_i1.p1 TRINITY_DN10772_c0_g1~~TRINITY_DN10772_c0_g1_i1.p1  ORF type:complete len:114 (+),score=7.75 TRINITY_DN10772_c0_g1_i1:409-750(+)
MNPKSRIPNHESRIMNPESPIPPESESHNPHLFCESRQITNHNHPNLNPEKAKSRIANSSISLKSKSRNQTVSFTCGQTQVFFKAPESRCVAKKDNRVQFERSKETKDSKPRR